jgi:Uma2 family endonuclease
MATVTPPQQEKLLTIEEYDRLPDEGVPTELVRGKVVRMNQPKPYRGWVCQNVVWVFTSYVRAHDLGYVMCNDSGVITERNPDTLRGADFAFYSYAKVPKRSLKRTRYLDVPPDLVFEVLSPDDRWPKVLAKVAEYLNAGVAVVGVLDPDSRTLHLYEGDRPVRILTENDELTLPALLGDFRTVVRSFLD